MIRVAGVGCLLALQVLLTRLLGVDRYGDYIYAFNWVGLLATFGCFGLDTAALRFVPVYRAGGEWGRLRGFLRQAVLTAALTSAVLASSLAVGVMILRDRTSTTLAATLFVAALVLPVSALMLLFGAALRAERRIVLGLLPQSVLRPVLTGVGVAVTVLLFRTPEASLVMAFDLVGMVVLVAAMGYALVRMMPRGLGEAEPSYEIREWLGTSSPLMAITGIRMLMSRADILLVGMFLGTAAAGVYAVASQLATLIGFGLMAVNAIAAPLFSQLWAEERLDELQRIVRFGARGVLAFALIVGGALLVIGRPLLVIVFGPEFRAAYVPVVVLVAAQVINAFSGSVGFLMSMTGNEREAARVTAMAGALGVALNLMLIPRLGILGGALATAAAGVVWNAVLVRRVWLRLGIRSTAYG